MSKAQRCEGKRHGFHRGAFGEFKCQRKAKGTVTTNVGFSRTHHICGDDQCFQSVTGGYPAAFKEYSSR